jgi:hypothetical protein
MVFQTSR